ncbi:MAG: 3-hexulose-6-phosphate synthase, partial [bacterium]
MKPILQLALDFVDLSRAIKVAEESVIGGIDWLEVGTPLIKSVGVGAIRKIRDIFPNKTIIADMKTMDAGRIEVEMAFKSGANIVSVLGTTSDFTILECVETAKNYGGKIIVDLINISIENLVKRTKEVEKLGVDYIGIHFSIDEQMSGEISFFEKLKEVVENVSIPVAIAGGINSETIVDAINAGASIIVIGAAITKSIDATKSTQQIKKALVSGVKIQTNLSKKIGFSHIRELLNKISTANLSDAFHRGGVLDDIYPIITSSKMVGPVLTVRTNSGDWAKPV